MIDDLRLLGSGGTITADLCIIGAGAAGITIAREFAQTPLKVCLVESGGLDFEVETQALYAGESIGLPLDGLEAGRLRFFGGTTNHWGGRCTPLDDVDFARKDWVAHSGWPLTAAELGPYYDRARALCGLGRRRDDPAVLRALKVAAPPLRRDWLDLKIWQSTPRHDGGAWSFGAVYRDDLARAADIAVLLHANLTQIHCNREASVVEAVTVAALGGASRRIEARCFVLSCGAIENARLLLLTGVDEAAVGLGNGHDLVGRYYMDHLRGRTAKLVTADRQPAVEETFNYFIADGTQWQVGLALSAAAQQERRILNCSAILDYAGDPASGVTAGQTIWRALMQGRWADDMGEQVWRVLRDMDVVAGNLERRLVSGRHPVMPLQWGALILDVEQAPNPESRVTLSRERDALGLQRVRVDWRLTGLERRTADEFTRMAAVELARLDFGRCRLDPWLEEASAAPSPLSETFHQTGTTRMAASPRDGVVDADCRVHGVANLFVAGSSVFATGGHANPTLTIVALSLRLADHMRSLLT